MLGEEAAVAAPLLHGRPDIASASANDLAGAARAAAVMFAVLLPEGKPPLRSAAPPPPSFQWITGGRL